MLEQCRPLQMREEELLAAGHCGRGLRIEAGGPGSVPVAFPGLPPMVQQPPQALLDEAVWAAPLVGAVPVEITAVQLELVLHLPQALRLVNRDVLQVLEELGLSTRAAGAPLANAALRPLDRKSLPRQLVEECHLVLVAQDHGNASGVEALVQVVGPRTRARRHQAEVAVALAFQVIPHEAAHVHAVLQSEALAQLHQLPAYCAVAISPM
mmetsp:Transcript_13741/g.37168  ORF Transcript_13741/g.37168 Transcript_13741/m.37168 type:complete len:210 (-) Transcript_13741:1396-2025(-)